MPELPSLFAAAASLGVETILNVLWQGTVLAVLAWCLLRIIPGARAATRYTVWYATLAAIFCLPVAHVATRVCQSGPAPEPVSAGWMVLAEPDSQSVAEPATEHPVSFPLEIPAASFAWLGLLGCLLAAAVQCTRLAAGYRHLRRIKAASAPVSGRYLLWLRHWTDEFPSLRTPVLRTSRAVRLPVTAGLTRPAVLFPGSLLTCLTEQEARAIWLHELAHLARLDDWAKLGQRLAEALLVFHPAVRWIGKRLSLEREIACDEWVVSRTGSRRPYAACLAKLAKLASSRSGCCPAPAMAADRKQIFTRLEMLIQEDNNKKQNEFRASGLAAVGLLAIAVAVMVHAGPAVVLAARAGEAPAVAPVAPPAAPAPPAPASEAASPIPPAPSVNPETPGATAAPAPRLNADAKVAAPPKLRELAEQMRPYHEEMRQLAQQMRQEMEPALEEIRQLADQIREKVHKQLQPSIEQLRALRQELRRERAAEPRNEARIKELTEQIRSIKEDSIRRSEAQIRELEAKIRSHEQQMRPAEESRKSPCGSSRRR